MFLENKYTKLYFKLTSISDSEEYTENHHIIPKCLGGNNDPKNLIQLSARKHFICHYLLIKMVTSKSPEFWKLIKAFHMLSCKTSNNMERYFNSRLYEKHKIEWKKSMSILQKGENNSQFGTKWIYCPLTLVSRRVPKNELQIYLDKGCEIGRCQYPDKFFKNIFKEKKKITKPTKFYENLIKEEKSVNKLEKELDETMIMLEFIKSNESSRIFSKKFPIFSHTTLCKKIKHWKKAEESSPRVLPRPSFQG